MGAFRILFFGGTDKDSPDPGSNGAGFHLEYVRAIQGRWYRTYLLNVGKYPFIPRFSLQLGQVLISGPVMSDSEEAEPGEFLMHTPSRASASSAM